MRHYDERCEKANAYAMKYMDGTISARESAWLKAHLVSCPDCQEDFAIYDFIVEELSDDAGLLPAPEGFTGAVMEKVAVLPSPKRVIAASLSTMAKGMLIAFSVLFGIAFLLILNRDAVTAYLSGVPALSRYLEVVAPVSERIFQVFDGAFTAVSEGFVALLSFIGTYKLVPFAIFLILAISQVLLSRKGAEAK